MVISKHQRAPGHDFVQWHMGLAQYQGLINQHIYGHQQGDRSARQILLDTARIDKALLSWANEIPPEFRPGDDLLCSNHEFHIGAFFSVQYFQAMISLHRAALIAPMAIFQSEVDNHCPDDPSKLRLRGGEVICANSARSIARLVITLSDRNIESRIFTAGPPLLACITLDISIMKNPGSRMQLADLELLKACVEYTANQYLKCGHSFRFVKAIIAIHDNIRAHIDQKSYEQLGNATTTLTKKRAIPDPHIERQHIDGLDWQSLQPQAPYNTPPASRDAVVNESTVASVREAGIAFPSHYQSVLSLPPDKIGQVMMAAQSGGVELNGNQDMYSGALPFDNFNVEELWNWMLITDSDDTLGDQAYDIMQGMQNIYVFKKGTSNCLNVVLPV